MWGLPISSTSIPSRAFQVASVFGASAFGWQADLGRLLFAAATCLMLGVCVVLAALRDLRMLLLPVPCAARASQHAPKGDRPRPSSSVADHAAAAGLQCEEHETVTDDGHTLRIHRFFSKAHAGRRMQPIIMQHGLLQRAGVFVSGNGTDSFAQTLAKAGYDVWLSNTRCTFSARGGWSWGLSELGERDFPAIVRYVATATSSKPIYLGHSQGCAMPMIGIAAHPEISRELAMLVLLAPAFYVSRPDGSFAVTLLQSAGVKTIETLFGTGCFMGIMNIVQKFAPAVLFKYLGSRMFSYLFNWHYAAWRPEFMDASFQFTPAPVSTRLIAQWMSSLRAGRLCRVCPDGADGAPYEVPCVAGCPVALIWGGKDDICDGGKLAEQLKRRSPQGAVVLTKEIVEYAHLDLIWAADANEKVLAPLMEEFEKLAAVPTERPSQHCE